jgi:hypothetical protein
MLLKLVGQVTEVVECLPSKGETLVSKPFTVGEGRTRDRQTLI